MGALGVVIWAIRGSKVVVGGLSAGGARGPTLLGSIRHRSRASKDVVLDMRIRDLRMSLEDRRKGDYRNDRK